MSTSRQRVSRLLQRALQEGIVEIKVHGYKDSNVELESQLERKFGLREVRVVHHGKSASLRASVIQYLDLIVGDGTNIGVTFGETLSQICASGTARTQSNVNVVQLLGGLNSNNVAFKPDEIANRFAMFFGGKAYSLYIPAIVDNLHLKELLYEEAQFQPLFQLYKEIDIAILAIGALHENSILIRDGYLSRADYDLLVSKGAVGDICFRFFDIDGQIVDEKLDNRVTGILTEDLKRIPLRMGVAYGAYKVRSIIAAIRGGYINVLVTDVPTARLLLECET